MTFPLCKPEFYLGNFKWHLYETEKKLIGKKQEYLEKITELLGPRFFLWIQVFLLRKPPCVFYLANLNTFIMFSDLLFSSLIHWNLRLLKGRWWQPERHSQQPQSSAWKRTFLPHVKLRFLKRFQLSPFCIRSNLLLQSCLLVAHTLHLYPARHSCALGRWGMWREGSVPHCSASMRACSNLGSIAGLGQ